MAWTGRLKETGCAETNTPGITERITYLSVPDVQHRKFMGEIEEDKPDQETARLARVPQGKMRLRLEKEDPRYLDLEVKGEDPALLGALSEALRRSDDVEYAGYRVDHPLTDITHLILKTKSRSAKPRSALRSALRDLGLLAGELQAVGDGLERGGA